MPFKENFKRELSRLKPDKTKLDSIEKRLDFATRGSFLSAIAADAALTCLGHIGSKEIMEGAPRVREWMNKYGFAEGLAVGAAVNLAFVAGTYATCKILDHYCKKQGEDMQFVSKAPLYIILGLATINHAEGAISWF